MAAKFAKGVKVTYDKGHNRWRIWCHQHADRWTAGSYSDKDMAIEIARGIERRLASGEDVRPAKFRKTTPKLSSPADSTPPTRHQSDVLVDGYLPLTELATYSGLSVRFLHQLIKRQPNPIPHYRFGTKIVVRRSEFDAWAFTHCRVTPPPPFDAKAYNDAVIAGNKAEAKRLLRSVDRNTHRR